MPSRRHVAKALAGVKAGTVLDYATERYGVHKGAFVAARIVQLALTTVELGHVPSALEYAEWWAAGERSAWRHRAEAREVFGEAWPDVVEQLAREIARRRERSPGRLLRTLTVAAAKS